MNLPSVRCASGACPRASHPAVQGSGFATYTQTLEVGTQLYSVQLYTGFLAGYTYTADSLHPGALRIGDVDGDGQLTDGDASVLIDAIEGGQAGVADLDRSGAADLVDLQMLAASLEETGDDRLGAGAGPRKPDGAGKRRIHPGGQR